MLNVTNSVLAVLASTTPAHEPIRFTGRKPTSLQTERSFPPLVNSFPTIPVTTHSTPSNESSHMATNFSTRPSLNATSRVPSTLTTSISSASPPPPQEVVIGTSGFTILDHPSPSTTTSTVTSDSSQPHGDQEMHLQRGIPLEPPETLGPLESAQL